MHQEADTAGQWTIARSAYGVALLSAAFSLTTLYASLPDSDLAKESGLLFVLIDPFVLVLVLPIAIGGATLSLPLAIWCLRGTDLQWTVPLVAIPMLVCAAATGPAMFIVSAPATLMTGATALLLIKAGSRFLARGN